MLEKGSASGREEAALALALDADQSGRWRGAERKKSAALKAVLTSAINPWWSSFETAAKKRKALGEENCGMFTGVVGGAAVRGYLANSGLVSATAATLLLQGAAEGRSH